MYDIQYTSYMGIWYYVQYKTYNVRHTMYIVYGYIIQRRQYYIKCTMYVVYEYMELHTMYNVQCTTHNVRHIMSQYNEVPVCSWTIRYSMVIRIDIRITMFNHHHLSWSVYIYTDHYHFRDPYRYTDHHYRITIIGSRSSNLTCKMTTWI